MPNPVTVETMPNGELACVDLWYPRNDGNVKAIRLGLMDVRAADSLIISYDFERDGWRIGMDETRDMETYADVVRENVEVAFVPAWNEVKISDSDPLADSTEATEAKEQ